MQTIKVNKYIKLSNFPPVIEERFKFVKNEVFNNYNFRILFNSVMKFKGSIPCVSTFFIFLSTQYLNR